MESLTIGRAARLAGAGVETIRFYEREGLLEKPPHRESGYRQGVSQRDHLAASLHQARQEAWVYAERNKRTPRTSERTGNGL